MEDKKASQPQSKRFTMEIPATLLDALRRTAAANERSVSAEVRHVLAKHVDDEQTVRLGR